MRCASPLTGATTDTFSTVTGVVDVRHDRVELRCHDADATLRAVVAGWPDATNYFFRSK